MGLHWPASQFPIHPDGLCQLHQFAVPFASRRWAIEGAGNHFIAVFVAQLLERSEIVYSIPPSLTSQYRSRGGRKKNDVVIRSPSGSSGFEVRFRLGGNYNGTVVLVAVVEFFIIVMTTAVELLIMLWRIASMSTAL